MNSDFIERHKHLILIQDIKLRQKSNSNLIDKEIKDMEYADTHGFFDNNTLDFVFSLVKFLKPKVCVVIGSGCGLIPRIIREAQLASTIGKTYLIDLGDTMGSMPDLIHNKTSLFQQLYPEIIIYKNYSYPQGLEFIKKMENQIDVLWIDGDHSFEGSKNDFVHYKDIVSEHGLIFMHDSAPNGLNTQQPDWCGVHKTIEFIKNEYYKDFEILNFVKEINFNPGNGLAIIKKNKKIMVTQKLQKITTTYARSKR
jgi:hypothetical protein